MNFTHKTWVKLSTFLLPKDERDKGAGFVEYAAVIVLVGVIAAVLYASGIGDRIVQNLMSAIDRALAPSS